MAITLKLVTNWKVLDLNSGRYSIGRNFKPPTVAPVPVVSTGTSLNRHGEGQRIEKHINPRYWSFEVRIAATSETDARQAIRDLVAMLSMAGDETDPLYVSYRPNSNTPEPLWGQQGASVRYKVIDGNPGDLWDQYAIANTRATRIILTLNLMIDGTALGKAQSVGRAVGGIYEDNFGTSDGRSRGMVVPEATTNLHSNPVFGHATYDNDWTTGSNLKKAQITNQAFAPFGYSSVKLSAQAASNNTFTQSITLTASTYRLSYYIFAPDRSALSSTQVQVVYDGTAQTTTYTNLGNGLWVIEASVTGTAAAHTCGIVVKNGYSVILAGAQCEAKTRRTPLAHGSMIGCAWSGTAHASSTTRTAASWSHPITENLLPFGAWSIRVALKTPYPSTGDSFYVFDARDGSAVNGPYLYYESSSDKFIAVYGGYNVQGQTMSFQAGETIIIYVVCTGQNIRMYVNGTDSGASASLLLSSFGANLFIGSSYAPDSHGNQTTLDFGVFDRALTATEISDDYIDLRAAISMGERASSPPWLWTKDGDNIVDNADDSTRDNYAIFGGIPGNMAARTEYRLTLSANLSSLYAIALGRIDLPYHYGVEAANRWYSEQSGTADAGSSGGQYRPQPINTSGLQLAATFTASGVSPLRGRECYLFTRIYDEGTTLMGYFVYSDGSSTYQTAPRSFSAAASAWRLLRTDPLVIPPGIQVDGDRLLSSDTYSLYLNRSSGTANVRVDYFVVMPRPLVIIGSTATAYATASLIYRDGAAYSYNGGTLGAWLTTTGDRVELLPDQYNVIVSFIGASGNIDPSITATLTYTAVYVTPRYGLL